MHVMLFRMLSLAKSNLQLGGLHFEVTTNLDGVSIFELASLVGERYSCNLQVANMLLYSTINNDARYVIQNDIVSKVKSPILPKQSGTCNSLNSRGQVNKPHRFPRQEADISDVNTESVISYFETVTVPRFQRCLEKLSARTGLTPRTPRFGQDPTSELIPHIAHTSRTPTSRREYREFGMKTTASRFE
eukprot:TRINITY_DN9858_c0_g1_i1.p1 TRINITY_DN9858_c0_g1~~TRINITY_DN9858_c0_g1_i1.p1  ORF type:complete len:189 (+),score=1.12 TRINITY_DN9858_c0_g1_i1:3-569(+)